MIHFRNLHRFSLAALATLLLSGCSGFLLGDENLSEPVDLASQRNDVAMQVMWERSVGDGTDGKSLKLQPFISDRGVYAVSSDGELVAYEKNSGNSLWRRDVGHRVAAGVSGSNNSVIVGSEDGLLMAFSTNDGSSLWHHQLSSEIVAAPTVFGGLVVARSIDGQVTALQENNGNVVWRQNIGQASLSIRGNSRSLFLDGTFLFTNDRGRLTLLAAETGQPVLDTPVSRGHGITAVERLADLLATPTIRGGLLFISAYRHETLAIQLANGGLAWRSDLNSALDLFADNRFVYLADKNSIIHALDINTGKVVWSSAAVEGRRISPLSGNGRYIVTVDYEGNLVALDSNNGQVIGHQRVASERTYVAPQWLDGKWLTYGSGGRLSLTELQVR